MVFGRRRARREGNMIAANVLVIAALMMVCLCVDVGAVTAVSPSGGARDLIGAVKRREKALGFRKTKNFRTHSSQSAVAYRCYYTGKLHLAESYEGLNLAAGTKDGCTVDPAKFDVFFYPVEAVGSGKTPVTASLEHASVERVLMVVPHEDFHASERHTKVPATLSEAASTLVGFLTAADVAREKFGTDSDIYRNLRLDPELFLHKSAIVNRYHERLARLYAAVQSGELAEAEAVAQKEGLFRQLQQDCQEIVPAPRSFNKCLSAGNNAGLAFDETYCKYYPMMYQLYAANGQNLEATLEDLMQVLAAGSEAEAVESLQALTNQRILAPLLP